MARFSDDLDGACFDVILEERDLGGSMLVLDMHPDEVNVLEHLVTNTARVRMCGNGQRSLDRRRRCCWFQSHQFRGAGDGVGDEAGDAASSRVHATRMRANDGDVLECLVANGARESRSGWV